MWEERSNKISFFVDQKFKIQVSLEKLNLGLNYCYSIMFNLGLYI